MSAFQSTYSQSSDSDDCFSTESFQFLAYTDEDQDKNSDSNSESTRFRTKNEFLSTEDKSNVEEIRNYLRNKSIFKNVDPCILEDENFPIPLDEESMKESSSSEQEILCPCTKITVADVMFMCLVLGLRHNLSWEVQIDIF